VIPNLVDAHSVGPADVRLQALVDISALDLSVSFESFLALADKMGWKVAALSIGHASARQLRVFTLVDVLAVVAIAGVALSAGAEVAAEGVGAVGEDVAGSVLALVVVRHVATLASVAIVTVALAVQAGAVLALTSGGVPAVVCALDLGV
jgi:hypothetical protein